MKIMKILFETHFETHLDHVIKVLHARLPVDPQIHRHVFILDELCREQHAVCDREEDQCEGVMM